MGAVPSSWAARIAHDAKKKTASKPKKAAAKKSGKKG